MVRPTLVRKMIGGEIETDSTVFSPSLLNAAALSQEHADTLKKALIACSEKTFNGQSSVVGKTGSAQQVIDPSLREGSSSPYQDKQGRKQYASTFAGFFPADDPKYSVICVTFTKPMSGTLTAEKLSAEIARKLAEEI